MGQQEVITFLKENRNEWFTTRQIVKRLEASFGSVTMCLKKLRESKQIKYKKDKVATRIFGKREVYVYKFKE